MSVKIKILKNLWSHIKRMMRCLIVLTTIIPQNAPITQDAPIPQNAHIVRPKRDTKTVYYRRYIIPKGIGKHKIKPLEEPLEENTVNYNNVKNEIIQNNYEYRNVYREFNNCDKENYAIQRIQVQSADYAKYSNTDRAQLFEQIQFGAYNRNDTQEYSNKYNTRVSA